MRRHTYQSDTRAGMHRHRGMRIPLLLLLAFLLGGFGYWYSQTQLGSDSEQGSEQSVEVQNEETVSTEPQLEQDEEQPLPEVQEELDAWLADAPTNVTYSVVVRDPLTETVLAEHNADETFFSASIYKLYVAYLGLLDIDAGVEDPSEIYNQGRSREQCITEMVRDSDSPCAEQMWNEQGKQASTDKLAQDFGFSGTSMEAVTTTARDAATLLVRLQRSRDLSESSEEQLRTALREQIYREAIPAGVPRATVYNKVGFYETGWLDAAIVALPSGREVVVVIFADNTGSEPIASMTEAIIAPLLEQ